MGNKRMLHKMSRVHKKAIRAQANFKKKTDTNKRVQKLRAKRTADDELSEEEEIRKPLYTVKVIDEEKLIAKISDETWQKVKQLPYVIAIPESFADFEAATASFTAAEICLYLKRMREYNSFLADYSKRDSNIQLFKYILALFDQKVKAQTFVERSKEGGEWVVCPPHENPIEAVYRNIYEMACVLPETFLDYIRNKLKAYVAITQKLEADIESEVEVNFPPMFQKDLFYFMKMCTNVMGTEKNLKILQTVLLVVSNLVDKVRAHPTTMGFLAAMAGLLIEEIANKEGIQGKYCPCMISCVLKCLKYFDEMKEDIKPNQESNMTLANLLLYGKLDSNSVRPLARALARLVRSFEVLYRRSEYRDYILNPDSDSEWTKYLSNPRFINLLENSKAVVLNCTPTLKSVLQLQKVQIAPMKTFKPAKEYENKEEKEEKKLKKEVKKAFRDAKRELKKDSEILHQLRQEEVDKRHRRNDIERKRVRRILEQETVEFKAMQSQERNPVKRGAKAPKKVRMGGNTTEKS